MKTSRVMLSTLGHISAATSIQCLVVFRLDRGEAIEPYSIKDVDLWLESNAHIQGEAFWLLVEGDSMTSPVGLSIPEGTYVLFDTGREPVNGSLVIAKLSESNEATFKS